MDLNDTYKINLACLKDGMTEIDYKIDGGFFSEEDDSGVLGADVDVHLEIKKRHESYRLDFSFDGELKATCDRCLEAVPLEVCTDYSVTVRHGEDYDTVENGEGEEIMVIPEDCVTLDVRPIIRDTLLLSIPLRCVHTDGECDSSMASKLREHTAEEEV